MTLTAVLALNAVLVLSLLAALAAVMRIPFLLDRAVPEARDAAPPLELAA
jgi:hypothetical protein